MRTLRCKIIGQVTRIVLNYYYSSGVILHLYVKLEDNSKKNSQSNKRQFVFKLFPKILY